MNVIDSFIDLSHFNSMWAFYFYYLCILAFSHNQAHDKKVQFNGFVYLVFILILFPFIVLFGTFSRILDQSDK